MINNATAPVRVMTSMNIRAGISPGMIFQNVPTNIGRRWVREKEVPINHPVLSQKLASIDVGSLVRVRKNDAA
jgi:hypothetical protein